MLEGYRRGDRAALARVFQHYAPGVSRWVTAGFTFRTKDGDRRFDGFRAAVDQHDVVHEVFRAAFEPRAREAYSGLTPFEGYLFIITRNVVLRRLKLAERDRPIDAEQLEAMPAPDPSPEERVAREQEVLVVRAFLSTLSEEERTFVDLRFNEQRPQVEVGAQLGWSRKKVRIQEAAVRERLIRFLKRRRGTEDLKEVAHDEAR